MQCDWMPVHETECDFGSACLLSEGIMAPYFILHMPGRRLVHTPEATCEAEARHHLMLLKATIVAYDCIAVSALYMSHETQFLRHDEETDDNFVVRVKHAMATRIPSERLSCLLTYRDGMQTHSLLTERKILRDGEGDICALDQPVFTQGSGIAYPLNLMPERPAPKSVRRFLMRTIKDLHMVEDMPQEVVGHA